VFLVVDQHCAARGALSLVNIASKLMTIDGHEGGILILMDLLGHRSPNGLRLSGERSRAKRVRCSRGLGDLTRNP
jgi:hypothetical protein